MHLYVAGVYNTGVMRSLIRKEHAGRGIRSGDLARFESLEHFLESYHYLGKDSRAQKSLHENKHRIFLDSGAFSAWTQGVDVDVDAYANFIKEHHEIIRVASVLDVIGDPDASWVNQKKLEALDCQVLPCYHYGEPIEVGKYYAANYEYITLGGMVGRGSGPLRQWLDEIWTSVLTDHDGYAICKVHGFGMTSVSLMKRYPWYSVDSTSWVATASYGFLTFPEFNRPIGISSKSPSRKDLGQHFSTLTEREQQKIRDLAAHYNLDLEGCANDYIPRYAFNAFAFHEMGKRMGDDHWRKPFKHMQRRLF